jgi:hypothetical protein
VALPPLSAPRVAAQRISWGRYVAGNISALVGDVAQLAERLVRKEFRFFALNFPLMDTLGQKVICQLICYCVGTGMDTIAPNFF